ncbi:MAG: hypothetical protein WC285_05750, partial [Candidatus Gracilibacteria bacterium]
DFSGSPTAPERVSPGGEMGPAEWNCSSFVVKAALCIKLEAIRERATVTSNSSCIQCEIDKINKAFNQTLSHSMIPNKATGNIMESATCKNSYSAPLIHFKVHVLGNPLPADPADDVMFGKNIISEWNKFVTRSQSYGFGLWDRDAAEEFAFNYIPPTTNSDQLVLSMEAAKAGNLADIQSNMNTFEVADESDNMMIFSAPVLSQMREMREYFESYLLLFKDTVSSCVKINRKECIQ